MEYPAYLELKTLQAENPEFTAQKPHLQKISLLARSGHELREHLHLFVEKRAGEEDCIYRTRLNKFSYSNTLGAGIAQLGSKLTNSPIHATEASEFWDKFRADNDGRGRTEKQLCSKLFSSTIKLQRCWAHVDKPFSDFLPRNLAEEQAHGLTPRVVVYDALQVPHWSLKENGTAEWVKVYQVISDTSNPLRKPLQKAVWTFIDGENIARYSHYVALKKDGSIQSLLNQKGEEVDYGDTAKIPLEGKPIAHGFGRCPVVPVVLSDELWAGNQAYAAAESCLRLECHRYDLLTAAYLQRTYKSVQLPDNDLNNTFVESENKPLPTGLQFVLELDKFEWSEPSGTIIEPMTKTLNETKKEIRTILALGGAYTQQEDGSNVASGVSKQMDYANEDERLASYGAVLIDALNDIYKLVGIGSSNEPPTLSGLEDFGQDSFSELLDSLNAIATLDTSSLANRLPLELYQLLMKKLISFLLSNLPPEQREALSNQTLPTDSPNREG